MLTLPAHLFSVGTPQEGVQRPRILTSDVLSAPALRPALSCLPEPLVSGGGEVAWPWNQTHLRLNVDFVTWVHL